MRKIITALVSCAVVFFSPSGPFAETITRESTIKEVTVYPGSARVTREIQLNLREGEHTIVFDNIIPRIDQYSLSVAGRGAAQVKIFGAAFKEEFLKETPDERVREIEKKIESLNDQISVENNKNLILDQQRDFLRSIQLFAGNQIPKDLVTKMPSVTDLNQVYQFVADGLMKVQTEKEDIRINVRDINRERQALEQQLTKLRGSVSRTKRSIAVDLTCLKSGSFSLSISYHVRGAYWRPVYDTRAQIDKRQVELATHAKVKQTTGEDWINVRMSLSTAQPTIAGRMPYVAPWILIPQEHVRTREAAPLSRGLQYEAFGQGSAFDLQRSTEVAAETAYAEVGQRGVSLEYVLAKPVTLASDGSEHQFPVSVQDFKVNYEYATFPRMNPAAFLGSRVENSERLQLLAGEVNLFLDGDYVGKSSIDNIMPGESFDLYLGVNDNIKVKREVVSKDIEEVLFAGIRSPRRKVVYRYKITVENYTKEESKIKLFESMPTAEDNRITVRIYDVSMNPTEKDWRDRAGIWLWEFSLKPREKKEIFYSFFVEHPRNLNIPEI